MATKIAIGLSALFVGLALGRWVGTPKPTVEKTAQARNLPNESKTEIAGQRTKLAAIELPPALTAEQQTNARRAIEGAFVGGFRLTMAIADASALASSASAFFLIRGAESARLSRSAARRTQAR